MKYYDGEKEYQIPEMSDWRFARWFRSERRNGLTNFKVTLSRPQIDLYKKGISIGQEVLRILNADEQGETRPYCDL